MQTIPRVSPDEQGSCWRCANMIEPQTVESVCSAFIRTQQTTQRWITKRRHQRRPHAATATMGLGAIRQLPSLPTPHPHMDGATVRADYKCNQTATTNLGPK